MYAKLALIFLLGIAFFEPENQGTHAQADGQENALGRMGVLEQARRSMQRNDDFNEVLKDLEVDKLPQKTRNRKRGFKLGGIQHYHSLNGMPHRPKYHGRGYWHNFMNNFKRGDHGRHETSHYKAFRNSEFSNEG